MRKRLRDFGYAVLLVLPGLLVTGPDPRSGMTDSQTDQAVAQDALIALDRR